jgi:hypothetical protein
MWGRDWHNRNFATAVAEDKQRWPECSKTQLHKLSGYGNQVLKPCFVRLIKAYRCVKFILSLDFLVLLWHDKRTRKRTRKTNLKKYKSIKFSPAHQIMKLPIGYPPTATQKTRKPFREISAEAK